MAQVLIIDDNSSVRQILKFVLTGAGHQPTCAANGTEGLRMFRELNPALVLLDIHMPLMSGYLVCEAIKRERPEVPVLMITGCPTREVLRMGRAAGAADVLKKPFELRLLMATISRLIATEQPHPLLNALAVRDPAAPTGGA